jgi:hypothetical protein
MTKPQTMQGTKYLESKVSKWREKAKERGKEISYLKRQIKDLKISREVSKSAVKALKSKVKRLESELNKGGEKRAAIPKHHSYSTTIIMLCIWLRQQGNCSLRSCCKILQILSLCLGIELSCPSSSSIQNWEKKLGYDRIHRQGKKGEDWVIILDESISIGQQKVLLILGINLSNYKFGKSLSFSDIEVLFIGIKKSWTGEQIAIELERLTARGFCILHGCSDGGSNLCKGLSISEIIRIEDCTHVIGNLMKKRYDKDETFQRFSKRCGTFKCQVMSGASAYLMPPTQRVKGRFLNLRELADWGHKYLLLLENKNSKLSQGDKNKLAWLKDYKVLITDIHQQCSLMNSVFKVLKNKGLNQQTKQECDQILEKSKVADFLKDGMEAYLTKNCLDIQGQSSLICCSDIIESMFGKYKNQLAKSGTPLITDACLSLANFTENFSIQEIKSAMENVKIVDLKNWRKENLPFSLIQQRRELLKSAG